MASRAATGYTAQLPSHLRNALVRVSGLRQPCLATVARLATDRCCRWIGVGDNKANLLKDFLMRHDCPRIGSKLSVSGFECAVLQREEPAAAPSALGNSVA